MARKVKVLRQARPIKVKSEFPGEPAEEVYTRYSKKEYELRRDYFDNDYANRPAHLDSLSYHEWVELGAKGGRPQKWPDDKTRKQAKRAQEKLEQGRLLTKQEKQLLGLIKSRPGARKYHPDRTSFSQERKARWKAKHGR